MQTTFSRAAIPVHVAMIASEKWRRTLSFPVICSTSNRVASFTDFALHTVPRTTTVVMYVRARCLNVTLTPYVSSIERMCGDDASGIGCRTPVTGSSNMSTSGSRSCATQETTDELNVLKRKYTSTVNRKINSAYAYACSGVLHSLALSGDRHLVALL